MLARLSKPTKPAAAVAVITPGNISWIIGDAGPSTPMPAVTLTQSMTQRSQNWGVLMASRAVTLVIGNWWSVVGDRVAAGRRDVGCQSSGGTRTVKTPNIMKAK